MVESHWPEIGGTEIRYRDAIWTLSGEVDVRQSGELLVVDAVERDDVRHPRGSFFFGLEGSGKSLNPTAVDGHFDRIERADGEQYIVVKTAGRTYRYVLERLQYD